MSHHIFTNNNVIGRSVRPTPYNYEQQTATNHFNNMYESMSPRIPNIYTQPQAMGMGYREQMPESEPLSEYTEMPMSMARTTPAPHRQMFASQKQMTPQRQMMSPMVMSTPQTFNMHSRTETHSPYQEMQSPRMSHSQGFNHRNMPTSSPSMCSSPSLNMMPLPSPQRIVSNYNPNQSFVMRSVSSNSIPASPEVKKQSSLKIKSTDLSPRQKLTSVNRRRFFVGTIEQVVQWHQMIKRTRMVPLYEVAGTLDSLTSTGKGGYHMIIRSEQCSNSLRAVFYPIDRDLPKVNVGELVTCVGRMIASKKMQVFEMWPTFSNDLVGLKRISFLCQRTLQEANLSVSEP